MKFSPTKQIELPKISAKDTIEFISKYWFRCVILFFAMQIFFNKNLSIQVKMNAVEMESIAQTDIVKAAPVANRTVEKTQSKPEAQKTVEKINVNQAPSEMRALAGIGGVKKAVKKNWKVSDFANLSFVLNPTLQERKNIPQDIVDLKNQSCHKYVERFARVAIGEMKKYGIPASVTLAQGLLESNAGSSKLSVQSENHFGIKCKPKCLGCTCRNYRDDDVYDMFRVFDTAWESYREHSVLLSNSRYKHLKKLGTKDYKNWSHGLKKAGYATDKQYAEKLIMIIEMLDLYQFDV
jgi:flagellum-specific peptidoglycan hydrolase FlgJ